METRVIDELPDVLKRMVCTVNTAAIGGKNNLILDYGDVKVVGFDKMGKKYGGLIGAPSPKTNDALYISNSYSGDDSKWVFIEFKSGGVEKADIYRKIYDSINALVEMKLVTNLAFFRKHAEYVLVCNKERLKPEAKKTIDDHLFETAKKEERLYEVGKFIKYLFVDTHTYSPEEFKSKMLEKWYREQYGKDDLDINNEQS